jgi:hypothetical protein
MKDDQRFWFRLERHDDQKDVITDFSIGSCPRDLAGHLLADCYEELGLVPRKILVFRNVLVPTEAAEVSVPLLDACEFFAMAGRTLLAQFGAKHVTERRENERGKINLVLESEF